MVLIEEIHCLRRRLPRIKKAEVEEWDEPRAAWKNGGQFVSAVVGGDVDRAYDFMGDMVLVRNIFSKIQKLDKSGCRMFSEVPRCLPCDVASPVGTQWVCAKEILDKIIHASHIINSRGLLSATNDHGQRVSLHRGRFVFFVNSLAQIEDRDAILAMCALGRDRLSAMVSIARSMRKENQSAIKEGRFADLNKSNAWKVFDTMPHDFFAWTKKYCKTPEFAKYFSEKIHIPRRSKGFNGVTEIRPDGIRSTNSKFYIEINARWDNGTWSASMRVDRFIEIIEQYTKEISVRHYPT